MIWEPRGTDRTGAETWIGVSMGRTFLIRDNGPLEFELSDLYGGALHGVFLTVDEAKAYAEGVA